MRVGIVAIGRMKQGPERELVARYLDRAIAAGKSLGLTNFAIAELNESRAGSAASRKTEEAKAIAAQLPAGGLIIALDERGKTLGSEDFAHRLGRWRDDGKQALSFVIGGADATLPGQTAGGPGLLSLAQP